MNLETAKAEVDAAIIKVVLPLAYSCVEELLQAIDKDEKPSKQLLIRCRQLLPGKYPHSFEHKK